MATLSQTSSGLDVSGGTSGTLSLTSVASGSLMIVVVCDADANAVTFAVTDDIGNDWRRAVGKSGTGNGRSEIWYCLNAIAGSPTITVTASSSTIFIARAQEWTASGGTWTLDTTNGVSSIQELSVTNHVTSGSVALIDSSGAAVVICCAGRDGTTTLGTRTAGTGYTSFNVVGPTDFDRAHWQYQDFSSAIANEQGAYTTSVSRSTVGCIAAFEYSGTGSGTGCWWPCCSSSSPGICTVRKLNSSGVEQWNFLGHLTRTGSQAGSQSLAVDSTNSRILISSGYGVATGQSALESVPFAGGSPSWVHVSDEAVNPVEPLTALISASRIYFGGKGFNLSGVSQFTGLPFTIRAATDVPATDVAWAAKGNGYAEVFNASTGAIINSETFPDGLQGDVGDGYKNDCDSSGNFLSFDSASQTIWAIDVAVYDHAYEYALTTSILRAHCVRLDSSDNIYVSGDDISTNRYLYKTNSAGSLQWSKSYSSISSGLMSTAVDSSGNVYVTVGTTLYKYNSSGTLQWSYDHGAALYDVRVDASDNVYIAGDQATA